MGASKEQRQKTKERRTQAVELWLAGVRWQVIADRLGYASAGHAHTDVDRALEADFMKIAGIEERRRLEVARCDRIQAAFWGPTLKGDAGAAAVVMAAIKQRVRLQGTEMPKKVNLDAQKLADEITALMDTTAPESDDDAT